VERARAFIAKNGLPKDKEGIFHARPQATVRTQIPYVL
jgi:hypothetical protein